MVQEVNKDDFDDLMKFGVLNNEVHKVFYSYIIENVMDILMMKMVIL
jgi:hypothetical protein